MDILDKAAVSYQLVLTKGDKIKPSELEKVLAETDAAARQQAAAFPQVLATSSETGHGIAELRAAVMQAGEQA